MENKKVKELQKRIEELEKTLFYIDMIDRWTREDSESYDKYSKELAEVKQLLADAVLNG